MTVQNPSGCFSMSTFGPLQKFNLTFAASGAFARICTLPVLSTEDIPHPRHWSRRDETRCNLFPENIRK